MQYFGEKLRVLRTDQHLTQRELAEKLGLVRATVSAYEQGRKYPSVEILIKLCTIFNVSADDLLGLSDSMRLMRSELTDEQMYPIRQIILDSEKYNPLDMK